mmetsp:Transcript_34797/g.63692  ORF Transcript_34797/g.63692 Transcript_34797/m.63692 type:complete len:205 (+) Transcript_34797:3-617(+)
MTRVTMRISLRPQARGPPCSTLTNKIGHPSAASSRSICGVGGVRASAGSGPLTLAALKMLQVLAPAASPRAARPEALKRRRRVARTSPNWSPPRRRALPTSSSIAQGLPEARHGGEVLPGWHPWKRRTSHRQDLQPNLAGRLEPPGNHGAGLCLPTPRLLSCLAKHGVRWISVLLVAQPQSMAIACRQVAGQPPESGTLLISLC